MRKKTNLNHRWPWNTSTPFGKKKRDRAVQWLKSVGLYDLFRQMLKETNYTSAEQREMGKKKQRLWKKRNRQHCTKYMKAWRNVDVETSRMKWRIYGARADARKKGLPLPPLPKRKKRERWGTVVTES